MGPLNEFEIRWLDVVQQNLYLQQANAGGPAPDGFSYPLTITGPNGGVLSSGVTAQGIITLQSDAWFLWEYLSAAVVIPTTALFGGPEQFTDGGNLLLQITLPGMGDDLHAIPAGLPGVPATNWTGSPTPVSAGIPYMFPTPVLLPPNTNINVSVTKLGGITGGDNPDFLAAYIGISGARVQVWS